jgi:hypothetical protein
MYADESADITARTCMPSIKMTAWHWRLIELKCYVEDCRRGSSACLRPGQNYARKSYLLHGKTYRSDAVRQRLTH